MSDLTLKVSEQTFGEVFNLVYPGKSLKFKGESPGAKDAAIKTSETSTETSKSKTYLNVTVPWFAIDAELHLVAANGIEFNDGNTFTINEIDIAWDKLILKVGLDIPTMKFGGFCLFKVPKSVPVFGGKCALEVPPINLFTKTPDIEIPLDLNPIFKFIITEISAICSIEIRAENEKGKDYWAVHPDPIAVDADLVDIHDTLGQAPAILYAAVGTIVLNFQAAFPATWVMDVFLGFVGLPTMTSLVLDVLDIHDDIEEWLMKALEQSIGIDNLLMEVIFDAILDGDAVFKTPKLFEILEEKKVKPDELGGFAVAAPAVDVTLPAVSFPVIKPEVVFDDDEMVLTFDFEF